MRALLISLGILLLVLTLSAVCSLSVSQVCRDMFALIDSLPEEPEPGQPSPAMAALEACWKEKRGMIALGVHFDYVYAIDTALTSTKNLLNGKQADEYKTARELLKTAVTVLCELERVSFENLF